MARFTFAGGEKVRPTTCSLLSPMVQGRIVDENHVRRRLFFPGPGLPSGGITVSLRGGEYVLTSACMRGRRLAC
jgi:hypothetical protein